MHRFGTHEHRRVQEARHSVAHIQTLMPAISPSPFQPMNPDAVRPGSGSGFLWDSQHVVTNFHVVQVSRTPAARA